MTAIPYDFVCTSENRPKWLEFRQTGIGASEAGACANVNPYSSPFEVYTNKLIGQKEEQSEPAYWGKKQEAIVRERFEEETGRRTWFWEELLRSKERPWQLATPDAWQESNKYTERGILEIKCTRLWWKWDEGIPAWIWAQLQHQLDVTGLRWGSLAVLFNGCEFKWTDFSRDDAYIGKLREVERALWDRVTRRVPPPPDGSFASTEALKRLYPDPTAKKRIVLDDSAFLDADHKLRGLKDERSDIEKDIRLTENILKAAIGDAEEAILSDGTVYSYYKQTRKAYEVAEKTFRVLRRK